MDLSKIIGLKVVAIKGYEPDRRKTKRIEAQYILFSDKKTYIEMSAFTIPPINDAEKRISAWVMEAGVDLLTQDWVAILFHLKQLRNELALLQKENEELKDTINKLFV